MSEPLNLVISIVGIMKHSMDVSFTNLTRFLVIIQVCFLPQFKHASVTIPTLLKINMLEADVKCTCPQYGQIQDSESP